MKTSDIQLAEMLEELNSRSKIRIVLEAGLYALILFLLVVGNSATLVVVALNSRMRTIPNLFVASLAISDLLLGILATVPIGFPTLVLSKYPFSDTTCQYHGYTVIVLALTSMQTLALMAVNRYYRVVRSEKYRRYFTKKKTVIMIGLSWFYSVWDPLPYILSGHKMVFHPFKFFCYLQIDSGPFTAFMVTVYVGPPTLVIMYCYLKIFQTVRSHTNNVHSAVFGGNQLNVEEIKTARLLFVIVVFFNLCWIPVMLIDIVDTIDGKWTFPRETYVAYSFLATVSSALNPIIYGLLNNNFRREYLQLFRCRHCRKQPTVEPSVLMERRKKIKPTSTTC